LTHFFTQNQWLNFSRKSDENTVAAAGQRRSEGRPNAQGRLLSTLARSHRRVRAQAYSGAHGRGSQARARANGVKFGRKRKLSEYQRAEAIKRRAAGDPLTAIAASYGVSVSMISRLER
jgi:hypothetical protein